MRAKSRLRHFTRRHRRLSGLVRSSLIFSAALGGAYGFLSGSQSETYNPHAFAIGASFLFAVACVALATLSMKLRWMTRQHQKLALHNEALADRNRKLKEAGERARASCESQGDVVAVRDAAGLIRFVNEAYCGLAGQPRENLLGSDFAFEVLEQGPARWEPEGAKIHDQKIAAPHGARWIAWREDLSRSDTGRSDEFQCVGRDITDRALTQTRDPADAASRAKSRFLAMASHEIRTPLNGIIGMSGLLLDTALTAEQATYANAVKTSGEALLALIEGLLDYSKIEAGKLDLELRPFVLTNLVEEIAELLAPRAQARNLEIAAYIDERLPAQVVGDAARLRQVLLNLAGNAVKFTAEGGVALIVEPGERQGEICFLVRDTGIGIAPEAQARIFREFEQADDRIARNYGGTGLGLSISERIVGRMGGSISVQSRPAFGSTFTVTLPLAAAEGEAGAPDAMLCPDLTGQLVLLVAPQKVESALIALRLQRWGASTCEVSEIAVAEALLAERVWDAILIDLALGAEQVAAFSARARPHALHRIVMMTPAARHEVQPPASAFTGYLVRPIRAASLAARLLVTPETASPGIADGDTAEAPALASSGAPDAPGRLSILVAEDNKINALLMRSLLNRLGHDVTMTVDGEQAVNAWLAPEPSEAPYDLILMDIQMPRLDGIEATKRIRAQEVADRRRRTPILALTANTLAEDRYACFEAGMDGFLVKPLDRDKLAEALLGFAASAA